MSEDTRKMIKITFIQLYIEKNMNNITIKELCQRVPIARTTFYSHFDNLNSVLENIEDEMISGLFEVVPVLKERNMRELDFFCFHDELIRYIEKQRTIVEALLVIHPDIRFMNKWKDVIKMHIAMYIPYKPGMSNYYLITEAIASAVLSAYVYWIENPEEYNEDELKKLLNKVFYSLNGVL